MRRTTLVLAMVACCTTEAVVQAAESKRAVPYFASIAAGRARMRAGPARTYPATWLYQRADLPVRVTAVWNEWRRVEDPDGTQGWMLANLLSETRTAVVRGEAPADMRLKPDDGATLTFRAAPGVVGHISQCSSGWCRFETRGRAGYIRQNALWGLAPGELVP